MTSLLVTLSVNPEPDGYTCRSTAADADARLFRCTFRDYWVRLLHVCGP